ncbi:MAG: hypothetical protein JJ900_10990 [Rhodospirillales bacterium]|nr:hypothetical protein [Rhodospirillales bacterium]MBO6787365.1 hypothetical protein [Rhodospirillales bacterium]
MNDKTANGDAAAELIDALGIDGFVRHMADLQTSLEKVADGIEILGTNAQRQSADTENLAAHVLAIEAVLTVILRQIPVNIADVRAEAERRARNAGANETGNRHLVSSLAEDIVKRADD